MRTDELVRIIVHDHTDAYVCEIDPAQVTSAVLVEQVNGEHSLTLTTSQELAKTDRLIVRDGMGTWHEYVVLGIESEHANGGVVLHEHYCVWSLQYDLSATYVNDQFGCGVVPGHASVPQTARKALECALEGTARWTIGAITVTDQSSASFYRRSGWDAMKTVLERWGGELQATITVSTTGVVGRAVDLLAHVGSSTATRRFDYGADLTGIKRTFADEVWPCRIVPLGKSMETEAGGYTRRPGIESVNGGVEWLQDDSVVAATRVPNGSGGWEYPTVIVTNDTYEEPADLKAWALEHISDYTTPKVTYEATVAQFAEAGLDPHGVALGDRVAIVDRTFGDGLRLSARVTKVKRDLVDPARAELSIGNADTSLAAQLGDISRQLAELSSQVSSGSEYQTGNAYLDALLNRINAEINATGGYTYITQGEGIRTYDVPVSDPLVGDEASKVVEVKGGNIRIADSKDSAGNWEWRTVIQSGYIAADVLNASNIQTGTITSYDGDSFWDLDTGTFERNLLWEPILTEASITTSSSSNTTYGSSTTSATRYARNGRYLIFFTTTTQIQADMEATLYPTSGSIAMTLIQQQLVRSATGAYRYAAVVTWPGSDGYTGYFRVRLRTTRASSSDPYPVYSISDVRAYAWPSTGSGTIGFNIHSQDNTDTMKMLLTGGGVKVSINDNETNIMPGEIDLTSLGDTKPVISFNPTSVHGKISYDVDDDMLNLGGYNHVLIGGSSPSAAKYGLYVNTALTVGPNWSTLMTSTKTDVFSSTGGSGVGIATVMAIKWGPFVRLRITGSSSSTTSYTNGIHLFGGVGTLLGSFTDAYKPMATDSKDYQEYTVGRVDSAATSAITPIGTAYFTYNATGIYIEKIILNNISTTATNGFRYGLTILYVRNI